MKLYRARTQEEYDWLMRRLEKQGLLWVSNAPLMIQDNWEVYKERTVIEINEYGVSYGNIEFIEALYSNKSIVEIAKLMEV